MSESVSQEQSDTSSTSMTSSVSTPSPTVSTSPSGQYQAKDTGEAVLVISPSGEEVRNYGYAHKDILISSAEAYAAKKNKQLES
ncbi:hypothetical protein N9112_00310 [bacterium]|nr:hypothetical protein [bacterium]